MVRSEFEFKMSNPDFNQHIRQIRDFEQLMVPAGKTPWVRNYTKPAHAADVVLYLGCNILRTAHLAYEVIGVFQVLGINFEAVAGPQFCCGIVNHRAGDIEGATHLFQATAEKLASYGPKQVVIWCPTCQLRFEEVMQKEVSQFSIIHATAFLAERTAQLSFRLDVSARVAIHGHVGKPQREMDTNATIRLLQAVPGVEVVGTVSSPDLDYQCSRALLAELGPERFLSIRTNLVHKARELGADTLVTTYHSCHREWCEVGEAKLAVRNYISIVAEALGFSRRDYFQEFKKLSNPDAIAALSRPVWETHGLIEAQAKRLAAKYFKPTKE
jgi:Fe-S oxidoreductase